MTASDVSAGVITALFSVPEGMAYAAIGGFAPSAGLYAGIAPAIAGSLLSRTVLMVTTLTSAIALTSHTVLLHAGVDARDPADIAALSLLVAFAMALMAAARLGAVLRVISAGTTPCCGSSSAPRTRRPGPCR
jgi:SulP family sulfate permease